MSRRSHAPRARLVLAAAISLVGLSGCASLGGNIKGSFSCKAPDGVCAPSSSIDDRALAMISGDEAGTGVSPAGPYLEERTKGDRATRTAASSPRRTPIQAADAARTQEKVLRIVFQPYIDERGRLHEASAVHAVVAQGEWQQQAIAGAAAIPPANMQASLPPSESLAEAVEQAGNESVAAIDPDLPDPAVVAAARARAADPVAAIKADVATRLAPKPNRRRASKPTTSRKAEPESAAATPSARTEKPTIAAGGAAPASGDQAAKASAPPSKTTAAAEATARVKADERYVAASREAQEGARKAASQASLPNLKPVLKPTVTTVDFPGAVPEDN